MLPDSDTGSSQPEFPRSLNVLLTTAAAIFVIAGMQAFSASLGPILLSLIIVVVVHPLQTKLVRIGVPMPIATIAMGLAAFGVLVAIVGSLVWSTTELVSLMSSDTYVSRFNDISQRLADRLETLGFTAADLNEQVANLDFQAAADQLLAALSSLFSLTSAFGLLVITMIFMVADADAFSKAVTALDQRPEVGSALHGFAKRTRSYFVVSTIFGLFVAATNVVALTIIGVPGAFVWGVLSFITNYIPNVGFIIGLVPPVAVAYFEGGWQAAAWVVVSYVALNTLIQGLLQPRVVGGTVGLSTTLTFLSLIFWGWVLGPIGALLAVPLSLLARALLVDSNPNSHWITPLISLRPAAADSPDTSVDLDPFDWVHHDEHQDEEPKDPEKASESPEEVT